MKLTVFGRDPQQADVVLSSTFVSGYHAELIQLDNGDMYLVDKSSNGTSLNGNKLVPGKETPVRRGDNVMFADVPLNWNLVEDLRMPADVKQVKTIGAHYTSNIKLQGAGVSRFHAALRQMKDGKWYICDYSKNGTTLNGQRLPKNTYMPIKANDVIVCAGVPVANPIPKKSVGKIIGIVSAAVVACAAIVCAFILPPRIWEPSTIFATYNPSIVLFEVGYHYEVECAGEDLSILPDPESRVGDSFTRSFPTKFILSNGIFVPYDGSNSRRFNGTGFFVGPNGHIATNLHIARPWLYDEELTLVERKLRADLSELAIDYKATRLLPLMPELKVVGVLDFCYALPNNYYYDMENAYKCSEVIASEDVDVDIALFRLQKTTLPEGTTYVPFDKISEKKIEVGEIVYTSGFSYGVRLLVDDILKNKQIQVNSVDGEISKNISDDSFMTTAPIAGGASGSPAFDKYGNLVGVMHAGVNGADNFNYAIYSYHLLDLMKKAKILE